MEQFNILVCDDDRSIVEAIEIYLKQENYHVIKAYNGLEALEALEENEIHLILMDVMMPLLDGLNTTVKIRESMNIPIIILSAKTEDTDKILGLNFGADDTSASRLIRWSCWRASKARCAAIPCWAALRRKAT